MGLLIGDNTAARCKTIGGGIANLGVGGDRLENVLSRVGDLHLPTSLRFAVILAGTNVLERNTIPGILSNTLISIGKKFLEKNPKLHIGITNILPTCNLGASRSYV